MERPVTDQNLSAQYAPARFATRMIFLVTGFSTGCLAPMFPFLKEIVGADARTFGLALLCLGIGSVVAMPLTGIIAARKEAKPLIIFGGYGVVAMLLLVAVSTTLWQLCLALLIFGACLGTADVAMNIHGAEVERRQKSPLMSNFHAMFSLGALIGAAGMTALLGFGYDRIICVAAGCALAFIAMVATSGKFMPVSPSEPEPLVFPRGVVVILAVLTGIAFLVEGAVLDWGALLIVELGLTSVLTAGVGYSLFSITMVIGRLFGDRIVAVAGPFNVMTFGGIVTILGLGIVLWAPWPVVALSGFLLAGIGAANLVPIAFGAAGRQTVMPTGLAMASVTTVGYAGVLMGPALIGFLAGATSIPTAFAMLIILILAWPLAARRVSQI